MEKQIGLFFLCIGLIVIVIALAGFQTGIPSIEVWLLGFLFLALAVYFFRRYRPEPVDSDRFRMMKKVSTKRRKIDKTG